MMLVTYVTCYIQLGVWFILFNSYKEGDKPSLTLLCHSSWA